MWPFEIPELCQIHPDYAGYGKADKRLHAQSNLSRGCGGVGLMWRNSIHASPVNIDSDRVSRIATYFLVLAWPSMLKISVLSLHFRPRAP